MSWRPERPHQAFHISFHKHFHNIPTTSSLSPNSFTFYHPLGSKDFSNLFFVWCSKFYCIFGTAQKVPSTMASNTISSSKRETQASSSSDVLPCIVPKESATAEAIDIMPEVCTLSFCLVHDKVTYKQMSWRVRWTKKWTRSAGYTCCLHGRASRSLLT